MINIDFTDLPKLMNNWCIPLLSNKNRYLVLKGGGGSGKSVFAAQKVIVRVVAEKGHRILVCRKVAKTIRESCFALLRETIGNMGLSNLFIVNKGDLKITCKLNNNEILFAGLDDVEKLKSINGITSIWIEEASELLPEDFRQLDIRLRGKTLNYKQMIISFNPIDINHWLKKEFFDVNKENSIAVHTNYKDNRFLDAENIKVLEAFKETDLYYYQVYCLGEWGVLGKTIFNAQIVSDRIAYLRDKKPLKTGYFAYEYVNEQIIDSSIKWVEDEQGYITIYEEPKLDYPYVIGGDTAGEGSDYFASHVIDNTTGKQVAVLHNEFDEDLYTKQMYCLGTYYNKALIGIENNYSTYPTRETERLRYPNMYVRQVEDSFTHKIQQRFGFMTTKLTRPLIIANLVQIVREHINLFNDIKTLNEMLTFVRNENGRAEAQEGTHDDLIMSLAITYYIREQQSFSVKKETKLDLSKFPADIREDYNNASPEMKKHILKKLGLL
jgi:phage terminase large subunit